MAEANSSAVTCICSKQKMKFESGNQFLLSLMKKGEVTNQNAD